MCRGDNSEGVVPLLARVLNDQVLTLLAVDLAAPEEFAVALPNLFVDLGVVASTAAQQMTSVGVQRVLGANAPRGARMAR